MYIHVPADFLRRRSVQSALIAVGMSNWLVGALENHEELTDFTLEYSVALLINVSALKVHCIMYTVQYSDITLCTLYSTVFSSTLIFLLEYSKLLTLIFFTRIALVVVFSHVLILYIRMNGAGKRACIADAKRILRVLNALLGHQNQELVPYINGALNSVLGVPAISAEALTLVRLTSLFSPLASHILHFSSVSCFTARFAC